MRLTLATAFATLIAAPALAQIQPQDGLWSGEVAFIGQTGCPQMLEAQLRGRNDGYSNETLTFDKPFTPAALNRLDAAFTWTQLGPDRWQGSFNEQQPTPAGPLDLNVTTVLDIEAEDRMSQTARVTVTVPEAVAGMLGMTGTICTVDSSVTHRHQ